MNAQVGGLIIATALLLWSILISIIFYLIGSSDGRLAMTNEHILFYPDCPYSVIKRREGP